MVNEKKDRLEEIIKKDLIKRGFKDIAERVDWNRTTRAINTEYISRKEVVERLKDMDIDSNPFVDIEELIKDIEGVA